MKKTILLSLLAAPLALAAPFQPASIPAEANWYLHGDLTALRESTAGGILVKFIRKEQANALADIENIFEFDPLTDLTDLTLFGNGKKDQGAVMLSGNLKRAHLESVIAQADDYTSSTYGTATLHHWDDKGKTQHAAFHGDQTLIISPQKELVQLALDVLARKKPGLENTPEIPTKNPFIVAFANIKKIDMPDDKGSRIIRRANSLFMALGEKNERLAASMVTVTDSPETARHMTKIMDGLVSLGELADENINALDIRHRAQAKDATMTMTMSLSVTKALELLSKIK